MPISFTRSAALAGVAALAVLLTACTGDAPEPSPTGAAPSASLEPTQTTIALPAPGDCIADTVVNPISSVIDADLTTIVDCTQPSHYAVYAVIPVDPSLLSDDPAADYVALQTEGNEVHAAFQEWKGAACNTEALKLTGMDAADFGDVPVNEAIIQLYGNFLPDATLATAEQWAEGHHDLVCSYYWIDVAGDMVSVALDGPVDVSAMLTADFPLQLRQCFDYEAWTAVTCDQPHYVEFVAVVNADTVMGADAISALERDSFGDFTLESLKTIDNACWPLVKLAAGSDSDTYRPVANAGSAGWGGEGRSVIYCGITTKEAATQNIVGSIIGIGDGSAELVPIG